MGVVASSTATAPNDLIVPDTKGFQEKTVFGTSDNFQLDNITNFSNAKIVDDVP